LLVVSAWLTGRYTEVRWHVSKFAGTNQRNQGDHAVRRPPEVEVDVQQFWQDPYPVLEQLRRETPIASVPALGSIVITRHADIMKCEKLVSVFSSEQPTGLMNKLMGRNMMRKDGREHLIERHACTPALSAQITRQHWLDLFQMHADRIASTLLAKPSACADLVSEYAMPVSAEALKLVTGLTNMHYQDMDAWSQGMIDGISNYTDDPAVQARCDAATAGIDACITERIADLGSEPDRSLLGVMLAAGLPEVAIRANIKLAISGGQNEPRDAIAGAAWAVLSHDRWRDAALSGTLDWNAVFDEYVRWISPIGMSPRRVAQTYEIHGLQLLPEDRVFLMFGSANRDESCFDQPHIFNPLRVQGVGAGQDSAKHIAFGAGPHFCAGAAVSRALVANVALPTLFSAIKELALSADELTRFGGWAFRGPLNTPICWDAAIQSKETNHAHG